MAQKLSPFLILAKLRLSVLAAGEALPSKCWDSTGLSKAGQADLVVMFPRTSILAAATHAAELARAHHDKYTRATGIYHLFRLPTELESKIHREMVDSIPNDFDVHANIWGELGELPTTSADAEEGPVNLNALKLSTNKDIAKLGANYKAAFDEGLSCIPYFTLAE